MSSQVFRIYSIVSAIGLIVGESWFVFTTNKYPPLWLDDYLAAAAMLTAAYPWRRPYGPALLLASWVFVLGNLYAMLFTRLEPLNPPGRPWKLLAVLVVWAFVSSLVALRQMMSESRLKV